jgi:hypothetical protein
MSARSDRNGPAVAQSRTLAAAPLIARFMPSAQREMRLLCNFSERYCQLLSTNPAGALAIASGYGNQRARSRALGLVREGRPAVQVAEALGIAYWFRHLPPEAFRSAMDLAPVPLGEQHERHIAQFIPEDAADTAAWLDTVRRAARAADGEFAMWVASRKLRWSSNFVAAMPELMGAFAWLSRSEPDKMQWLGVRPFSTDMSFDTALKAFDTFRVSVHTGVYQSRPAIVRAWLAAGEVDGFEFVPLLSMAALRSESALMHNCVPLYMIPMAEDRCRLFSIRRQGVPLATIEIRGHECAPNVPSIIRLLGIGNKHVGDEVWRAAYKWLAFQAEYRVPTAQSRDGGRQSPNEFWMNVFGAYLEAKGPSRLLRDRPSARTLASFTEVVERMRRAQQADGIAESVQRLAAQRRQ